MKKFLSFTLVIIILSGVLALPSFAQRTNVSVDALRFTKRPEFDGVLSEAEWGPMTISVKGSEAATMEDDSVNEFNTYTEFETEAMKDLLGFDLWLRWDDDYFYMGAIVHDPDGLCCPYGGKDLWNGDILQTRIDPYGPSSVMTTFIKDWNYLTDPWTSEYIDFGEAMLPDAPAALNPDANLAWREPTRIINSAFGLVKGLFPQGYNGIEDVIMKDTDVAIAVVNTGDGENTFTCDITYEIAIPWKTIVCKMLYRLGYEVKEGNVLGITVGTINSLGVNYNAFLQWGSGIFGGQFKHAPRTVGGSNAVTLSGEEVTPADEFPVYTEPVTTEFVPQETEVTSAVTAADIERKVGGPVDIDVDGGPSVGTIISIAACAVAVAGIIVFAVVASKKKGKNGDKAKKDDTSDKAE